MSEPTYDPAAHRAETRSAYDRLAGVWSATTDDGPYNGGLERPALRTLVPQPLTGRSVLDAGCGSGAQCRWLLDQGADPVGVDLSPQMVDEAARRCGGRGRFVVADLADPLPVEPRSLDGITCSLALHYLRDWTVPLRSFATALRPGGWAVISLDHPFGPPLPGQQGATSTPSWSVTPGARPTSRSRNGSGAARSPPSRTPSPMPASSSTGSPRRDRARPPCAAGRRSSRARRSCRRSSSTGSGSPVRRSVQRVRQPDIDDARRTLQNQGFARVSGTFATTADAWTRAGLVVDQLGTAVATIEVIGEFVIPPPDGGPSRDFQTLHFDFGLPLVPAAPTDVARFTALHVPLASSATQAFTRLVPLSALLGSRTWPERRELLRRFAAYGDSHGGWDTTGAYVEGSLARVVEAALDDPPVLPSVRTTPGFLCGAEFSGLAEETVFLTRRGLPVDAVAVEVCLQPGELLVFDNLAVAHGRRGTRQPGELHQRVFGHRQLPVAEQISLRDCVLANFAG